MIRLLACMHVCMGYQLDRRTFLQLLVPRRSFPITWRNCIPCCGTSLGKMRFYSWEWAMRFCWGTVRFRHETNPERHTHTSVLFIYNPLFFSLSILRESWGSSLLSFCPSFCCMIHHLTSTSCVLCPHTWEQGIRSLFIVCVVKITRIYINVYLLRKMMERCF